jgi:radical SAM protein with 4Fe4S-binding SPASM domain
MEIDLHVTNRCNLRCKHCVYKSGDWHMIDMSVETVQGLIGDFKDMGVEEVHITGGEPLLNSQLIDIIALLNGNNFTVRIQTNGMLITKSIAQNLKNAGASHVLISIDGLRDSHNVLRSNERSFDAAITAVRICIDAGLFTRVNTVIHKGNVHNVAPLVRLIAQTDADQHSFFYFTPTGRGENMLDKIISLEEWKEIQDEIKKIAISSNVLEKIRIQDVYHENDVKYNEFEICRRDNCLILANGDVFHCVFFVYSNYRIGNIYENSLKNIWKDVDNIVDTISKSRVKSCSNSSCGGGCPGMAYILSKSVNCCDVRCRPDKGLVSSCIRRYRIEK